MSLKLLIGAALTALVSLFSAGPDTIAGRITAVEGDSIRVLVDGQGDMLLRMDEQTGIQTLEPWIIDLIPELPCVDRDRANPVDIVGERVTVLVEFENGVVRPLTVTVVPGVCGATITPRTSDSATTVESGSGRDGR